MLRGLVLVCALLIFPVSSQAQQSGPKFKESLRIENVEAIIMANQRSYTLLVRTNPTTVEFRHISASKGGPVTFITDVPDGKPMWVKLTTYNPGWARSTEEGLEIHVRSVQDVKGIGNK